MAGYAKRQAIVFTAISYLERDYSGSPVIENLKMVFEEYV